MHYNYIPTATIYWSSNVQCDISMMHITYGLLTKCEVKMAGYWPSSLFACLWTETKSRSINLQKRMRPISSHLDRTNLVNKGFIIWLLVKFCLRDTGGSPEAPSCPLGWPITVHDLVHLARSRSQPYNKLIYCYTLQGTCLFCTVLISIRIRIARLTLVTGSWKM